MIVVIWIDWYAYHHARLRALVAHPRLGKRVIGIEMVGRTGVHKGLVFRENAEASLPLRTLMPDADWNPATQRKLAVRIWAMLNRQKPSMILVPGYYTLPAFAAALWGKLHGCRTVLMTESTQHDHSRSAWKEMLKGMGIRWLFDGAIAGGKAHLRYLRALGFPEQRTARGYNVVDNRFFAASAAALRTREETRPPFFLYVGRLAPEKNIQILLHAYARYRGQGGEWPLVLVGGGPEEASLRRQAETSGCGASIQFAGLQSTRELPAYYAHAGCFVLPSQREPWGLVVNEAMASGLPVIVSNTCGVAEDLVETDRNGFVFDPRSAEELCERLLQISALPPDRRAEMGRASQEMVDRFSPERWAAEVCRLETVLLRSKSPVTALEETEHIEASGKETEASHYAEVTR